MTDAWFLNIQDYEGSKCLLPFVSRYSILKKRDANSALFSSMFEDCGERGTREKERLGEGSGAKDYGQANGGKLAGISGRELR